MNNITQQKSRGRCRGFFVKVAQLWRCSCAGIPIAGSLWMTFCSVQSDVGMERKNETYSIGFSELDSFVKPYATVFLERLDRYVEPHVTVFSEMLDRFVEPHAIGFSEQLVGFGELHVVELSEQPVGFVELHATPLSERHGIPS